MNAVYTANYTTFVYLPNKVELYHTVFKKMSDKKQIELFTNEPQIKLNFEGEFAAASLKIQKITELLQKENLSPDNRQMWLKELKYYQELLRSHIK